MLSYIKVVYDNIFTLSINLSICLHVCMHVLFVATAVNSVMVDFGYLISKQGRVLPTYAYIPQAAHFLIPACVILTCMRIECATSADI